MSGDLPRPQGGMRGGWATTHLQRFQIDKDLLLCFFAYKSKLDKPKSFQTIAGI
jgi:hypothetical protein